MFPVYENKNRVKGYKKLLPGMHQLPATLTSQGWLLVTLSQR